MQEKKKKKKSKYQICYGFSAPGFTVGTISVIELRMSLTDVILNLLFGVHLLSLSHFYVTELH